MALSEDFYFYLEFSFFLLNLVISIAAAYKLRKEKSKAQLFAFLFILAYGFSNFFSALNRYSKLILSSNPMLYESLSKQGWFFLIDQARLKYCFIIIANLYFNIFHYEIYSKPKKKIYHTTAHFTTILLCLHLVPFVSSSYKFLLKFGVFIYSLITLIPIIIQSHISMKQIKDDTKQNVKATLFIAYLLGVIIICALFDPIFNIFFNINFSIFYFIAWIAVLGAIFFASHSFILNDWNKIKKDIKNIINSDEVIYLSCPKCHTAKYYDIPDSKIKKIHESPTGITPIVIPKNITCEHEYIIYIDKKFHVRSREILGFIAK